MIAIQTWIEWENSVPTNTQRISAVTASAAIVLAGGWLASLAASAVASKTEEVGTGKSPPEKRVTTQQPDSGRAASATSGKTEEGARGKAMVVSISGIRNDRGKIYVALFDDATSFSSYDYGRAAAFRELPAQTGSVSVRFSGLVEKPYAISLFHDENGNQEFDMSEGYPAEGYGTSRATSAYDEPKFHQARIGPGPVSIKIYYLQ